MFFAPFLSTLLNRVKAVVRRVAGARAVPVERAAAAPMSPELRARARGWLAARLAALSAALRRIEARLPVPARKVARRASTFAPGGRAVAAAEGRLPRGLGWMCAVSPEMRQDGAAFAAWLGEAPMRAMVDAAPADMARLLSPILHAAGQRRPDWFPKRVKRALPPCGGGSGWGVEASESCGDETETAGPRAVTPPPTPSTRGEGSFAHWPPIGPWRCMSRLDGGGRIDGSSTYVDQFSILGRIGPLGDVRPIRYDLLSKR
jgi:hypothetical protein